MALTTSDLARIRAELGYNTLSAGAEPYISYVAVFDVIVKTYMQGGASTTSSTTVAAATAPTAVSLVLTDATGFTAGDRCIVAVDSLQEAATIRGVTGSTISVILSLAHAGTYPVTVEGGETLVRAVLKKIDALKDQFAQVVQTAGLKRAEDIEWYQAGSGNAKAGGSAQLAALFAQRDYYRDELAALLGVQNLWRVRQGAGSSVVMW